MLQYLILVVLVCWCRTTSGRATIETSGENDIDIGHIWLPNEHASSNASSQDAQTSWVRNVGDIDYTEVQRIIYNLGLQSFKKHVQLMRTMEMPRIRNDYTVTPGIGAHKLHRGYYTWNNARQTCVAEGGHLAIINSDAEEELLIKRLKENNLDSSWLGIHDLYEEGEWVTVLDQSLASTGFMKWTTNWSNVPDGGTVQNCGALTIHGGIDDGTCSSGYTFFCEIPIPMDETATANAN